MLQERHLGDNEASGLVWIYEAIFWRLEVGPNSLQWVWWEAILLGSWFLFWTSSVFFFLSWNWRAGLVLNNIFLLYAGVVSPSVNESVSLLTSEKIPVNN
jgi:hypothetical protein